jgi:transcriptional regulator with XRE-family HTH domain
MQSQIMPTEKGFFAVRLKDLRTKAELSQADLAEQSGVAVGTIRHFEYGIREPTYETLVKLAHGLSVSLSEFDQPAEKRPRKAAEAVVKPTKLQPKKSKK